MKVWTVILGSVLFAAPPAAETINFDKAEAGKAPAGWNATQTGTGQATGRSLPTTPRPASRMS